MTAPAPALGRTGLAEFALRASTHPGWLALVAPSARIEDVARELALESEAIDDTTPPVVQATTANGLVDDLKACVAPTCIVAFTPDFGLSEWRHLDLLRSQLERDGTVVLVLTAEAMENLTDAAPNLASWLGGSVWELQPDTDLLSPDEVEQRLQALRSSTSLSDEDVLGQAGRGELPADPEFAEWLVLLGRGDLVPRG